MLYEHNPIRDQVAGSVESIAEITADTLYSCHKAFYAPSNMALCIAADCDPERIFEIADSVLTRERSEVPRADMGEKEGMLPLSTYSEEHMEVSAPQFLIGAKLLPEANGPALLRQKLIAQLALRTVFGSSGEFYNRLYAEGVLNRDYDYEADFTAGTATVIIGGESAAPQRVLSEVKAEIRNIRETGIDDNAFETAKRASFGSRLRALESFDSICLSLVDGVFGGYCAFDSFDVLQSITRAECEEFLTQFMAEDRLAMSVISPIKV